MNSNQIGRFSTPLENYSRELYKIKTLAELKAFEEKYRMFLDDAEPCFARIHDEQSFAEFRSELQKCRKESKVLPSEEWLNKFSAIPLPELFIRLVPLLATNMGSGFVMNRLLDEKMAVIQDGRFRLTNNGKL